MLVEPARAANVGAAARAIKTMGFSQLAVVNSVAHREEESRWTAHGATDVLDAALSFDSVAAVRAHCDLLVGTTVRERSSNRLYHSPAALHAQLVNQTASVQRVGLVFGREASGLHNDELALCDVWSSVPLAQPFPSLNLAQAVMVYAHALSGLVPALGRQEVMADAGSLQHLLRRVTLWLDAAVPDCDPTLREWLAESLPRLSDRDVRMAHLLINRLCQAQQNKET